MKNRELQDLKNDKDITPEDVARFSLYENDLNDSGKFTAICDLVVCCERSQTEPLKQKIAELEGRLKPLVDILLWVKKQFDDDGLENLSIRKQVIYKQIIETLKTAKQ